MKPSFILFAQKVKDFDLVTVYCQDGLNPGRFVVKYPDGGLASVDGEKLLKVSEESLANYLLILTEKLGATQNAMRQERSGSGNSYDYYLLRDKLEELNDQFEYVEKIYAKNFC